MSLSIESSLIQSKRYASILQTLSYFQNAYNKYPFLRSTMEFMSHENVKVEH